MLEQRRSWPNAPGGFARQGVQCRGLLPHSCCLHALAPACSTLRFACRAKRVVNNATVNEVRGAAWLLCCPLGVLVVRHMQSRGQVYCLLNCLCALPRFACAPSPCRCCLTLRCSSGRPRRLRSCAACWRAPGEPAQNWCVSRHRPLCSTSVCSATLGCSGCPAQPLHETNTASPLHVARAHSAAASPHSPCRCYPLHPHSLPATRTSRRRSTGCAPSCCARTRRRSACRWRWRQRRRSVSARRWGGVVHGFLGVGCMCRRLGGG